MSKSIDVLAKDCALQLIGPNKTLNDAVVYVAAEIAYKAGYKQRSGELIDLLVELEEYFEKRQDADWEGEETGMVPNKEMCFYGKLKEELEKMEVK